MKASETKVEKFLANNETTFAIPVYQRNYDWTRTQCEQLLRDIMQVGQSEESTMHFIGSVVYVHDDVYTTSGLTELTIIDGQQRLTTITLLYIALYRHALSENNRSLSDKIYETYLVNKFAEESEKLKLKPTDNNKIALSYVLTPDKSYIDLPFSRILENFRFFFEKINSKTAPIILKGLQRLVFVEIALDRQKDSPQRIFESLNSTGLELSQADLIRNYILMGLPRVEQEQVFSNFWAPIEESAKNFVTNESRVSDFVRDYLTMKNKEIPNKSQVYEKFKENFPTPNRDKLIEILSEIRTFAKIYSRLLNPDREENSKISRELHYINSLEISVAYPFLMQVYQDYDTDVISDEEFLFVLKLVQSFAWRRFIVGLPTHALNKIFMNLYDRIDKDFYLPSLEKSLMQRTGTQRFPRDVEVIENLKYKDIYNTKPKSRNYFFDKIENFNNSEVVDVSSPLLTIEHIFPQNPDLVWKQALSSDEFNEISDKYLNTIGNLMLSGNNGKLGNKGFIAKRDMNDDGLEQGYAFSRLWLNRALKDLDRWGVAEIQDRIKQISERFLYIWPAPNVVLDDVSDLGEVNIFDAEEPRHKKLEYAVFFGKKIIVRQVARLYVEIFSQLFDLQPEAFQGTRLSERLQISADPAILRSPLKIADGYFIEGNLDNKLKFDRMKAALSELGIEDELSVKFEA